jgi:hypothetical protein
VNRRHYAVAVVLAGLIGLIAVVLVNVVGETAERTICQERERALERIDEIEGPGYEEGLDSLDALRTAAERADPPDTELRTLIDELKPLLQEVANVYADGGYDAVDAMPSNDRTLFEQLTNRLDTTLGARCGDKRQPPSPGETVPTPTTREATTTTS